MPGSNRPFHVPELIRRAFSEFLSVPTYIIAGFVVLAVVMIALERAAVPPLVGVRERMQELVFSNSAATSALLATIAGALITLTSITFSVLLLAVQQAAASLSHAVFDQFLRRPSNQVYFGFFTGLALYSLLILAATGEGSNPVLGASVALILSVIALLLLIILIYATIDQMRPAVIVDAIHDHVLKARQQQLDDLKRTRHEPMHREPGTLVSSDSDGFVVAIDLDAIGRTLSGGDAELIVHAGVGSYVAHRQILGELRGVDSVGLEDRVRAAFTMDRARDIDGDPAYGVEQLANIAWTSISTSKQNPAPGRLVIMALRDLISRTSREDEPARTVDDELPIVYTPSLLDDLMDALELMAVVCSESMQVQNMAEVLNTLTVVFFDLPARGQRRIVDIAMRSLSGLGDELLTAPLARALERLASTIEATYPSEAAAVTTATRQLGQSIGRLNSRATRVSPSS